MEEHKSPPAGDTHQQQQQQHDLHAAKPPPDALCTNCKCYKIKPEIPMYGPYNLHLEPGKIYLWCTCGKSKKQPFCDGSHKGTGFKSLKFSVDVEQRFHSLCGCKYTTSPPFCNGYHSAMPAEPDQPPCVCSSRNVPTW